LQNVRVLAADQIGDERMEKPPIAKAAGLAAAARAIS
jgi:Flp pilus assembly protein CpaB